MPDQYVGYFQLASTLLMDELSEYGEFQGDFSRAAGRYAKAYTDGEGTHFYDYDTGDEIGLFAYSVDISEPVVVEVLDELYRIDFEDLYYEDGMKEISGVGMVDFNAPLEEVERVLSGYMNYVEIETVEEFKSKTGL